VLETYFVDEESCVYSLFDDDCRVSFAYHSKSVVSYSLLDDDP
jgi:hypothetical protein